MNREESYFIAIRAKADPQKIYDEAEPAAERLCDVLEDNFDLLDYCETDPENL